MTVVLCGVGADTGNVRPVPTVDGDGRFEYVPIPEKGATAETATYGSLERSHADGSFAELLDGVRPGSDGEWITDADAIADAAVHHDPNLGALTYGEHRAAYVARLATLEPGDVVAFYAGFRSETSAFKHRYLFGYFTVAAEPDVLEPEASDAEKAAVLDGHPENAHAKRYRAHGDLYYHDPAFTDRPESVVLVPGTEPGGVLDRAIKLSDERRGPNYYMTEHAENALNPASRGDHGVHVGGIKPAIRCDVDAETFLAFVDDEIER